MRETSYTHALFSLFVSSAQAETIEGDLLEESADNRNRLIFFANVLRIASALLIHQLRQTPMQVFLLCIFCIMFLKILEMFGLYLMLFVLGFNSMPLLSAFCILGIAIAASYLAVLTCLHWMPGFTKLQVVITALMLMVYALVNCGIIIGLAGSMGSMGSMENMESAGLVNSNAVIACGKLMIFETLFHIVPILFAGFHFGNNINPDMNCLSNKDSGY